MTGVQTCALPICAPGEDGLAALEALASAVGTQPADARHQERASETLPAGALNAQSIARILAALIPENGIVVDESITTGRESMGLTAGAAPHDWLQNMGGSIGFGTPVAVGAAVACPNRKVIAMIGDGSAMYTIQSLWTMAREGLDICVMIFSNRSYNILYSQLASVGVPSPGPRAIDMLTLGRPEIDFMGMAKSLGMPGAQVRDLDELCTQLTYTMSQRGPYLIDVLM